MKSIVFSLVLCIIGLQRLLAVGYHTETFTFSNLNIDIPDGNATGVANIQNVNSLMYQIYAVEVGLSIAGSPDGDPTAFNGDLYVTLTHNSGTSVLLNRIGKTLSNTLGYGDNGLTIFLSDVSSAPDIHLYQNSVVPALGESLLGTWSADGRNIDPDVVTDGNARNAGLNQLNNGLVQGQWTLFVADMETGAEHRLDSWSLSVTGVPEPCSALFTALGGTMLALRRYRRKRAELPNA